MSENKSRPPEYGDKHHWNNSVLAIGTYVVLSAIIQGWIAVDGRFVDESIIAKPLEHFIVPFAFGIIAAQWRSTLLTPGSIGLAGTVLAGLGIFAGPVFGLSALSLSITGIIALPSYGIGYWTGRKIAYKKEQ